MASSHGRRGIFLGPGLMVAVFVLGLAGFAVAREQGRLNEFLCEGECGIEYAIAPPEVREADLAPALPQDPNPAAIDAEALAQQLAAPLAAPALGAESSFLAVDGRDGTVLVERNTDALIPASTTKVLTTWAALRVLGPDHRFTTAVHLDGDDLVLVGGGDPLLVASTKDAPRIATELDDLAEQVARELGRTTVRLRFDDSLFTGPAVSPAWPSTYVPQVTGPVSALSLASGRPYSTSPAAQTARAFAAALTTKGVTVTGDPVAVDGSGGEQVAVVRSAPLREIVRHILVTSDNAASEIVFRHVGLAVEDEASFAAGVVAVSDTLEKAGVSVDGLHLDDGSGLSRGNRISAATLVETLIAATGHDRTSAVVAGMPIAGLNGTLEPRFGSHEDALGLVRAKTGTLMGVHALAGWATLSDGRPIAFAVLANGTQAHSPFATQAALDAIAASIVSCDC